MKTNLEHELLTVAEVADYLRCTRRNVYAMLAAGRLRRINLHFGVRIHRDDLERYLDSGMADELSEEPA